MLIGRRYDEVLRFVHSSENNFIKPIQLFTVCCSIFGITGEHSLHLHHKSDRKTKIVVRINDGCFTELFGTGWVFVLFILNAKIEVNGDCVSQERTLTILYQLAGVRSTNMTRLQSKGILATFHWYCFSRWHFSPVSAYHRFHGFCWVKCFRSSEYFNTLRDFVSFYLFLTSIPT